MEQEATAKMALIEAVFRECQLLPVNPARLDTLAQAAEDYPPEFRSIAYESIAMNLALHDIGEGLPLTNWRLFLQQYALPHATQYHIGLGWALAKLQADIAPYLHQAEEMMRYRIADGYGYYEGFFKRRQSVMAQQHPAWENETALQAYNQGLGRSLWYTNKATPHTVAAAIGQFAQPRQAHLWRGLGIAAAYVGGINPTIAAELLQAAGPYSAQLAAGAAMAAVSRYKAGFLTPGAEVCCQSWWGQTATQTALRFMPGQGADTATYPLWVARIENSF